MKASRIHESTSYCPEEEKPASIVHFTILKFHELFHSESVGIQGGSGISIDCLQPCLSEFSVQHHLRIANIISTWVLTRLLWANLNLIWTLFSTFPPSSDASNHFHLWQCHMNGNPEERRWRKVVRTAHFYHPCQMIPMYVTLSQSDGRLEDGKFLHHSQMSPKLFECEFPVSDRYLSHEIS